MRSQVHRTIAIQLTALTLLLVMAETAKAEFISVSESAVFNPSTQEVLFTIEFNQTPDFFTVDSFGRQANSFQFFITGDPGLPYPARYDAIIRAEEIHITMDVLRVRNAVPPDPDPAAGGWGSIRGAVPFSLNGSVLTFSTPLQLISDHSTDGRFAYGLQSYQFGALTRSVNNQSVVVPEPTSLTLLSVGALGLLIGGLQLNRRSKKG